MEKIDFSESHESLRDRIQWITYGESGRDEPVFIPIKDLSDYELVDAVAELIKTGNELEDILTLILNEMRYRLRQNFQKIS